MRVPAIKRSGSQRAERRPRHKPPRHPAKQSNNLVAGTNPTQTQQLGQAWKYSKCDYHVFVSEDIDYEAEDDVFSLHVPALSSTNIQVLSVKTIP